MAGQPDSILLTRFRLQPDALSNVKKLDFVWQNALDKFTETIAQARSNKVDYKERPTYRRLNSALISAAPQLVHAFEKVPVSSAGQKPAQSIIDRQMLALVRKVVDLPTPKQINEVVKEWAKQWAQSRFKDILEGRGRHLNLLSTLLKDLDAAAEKAEWQEIAATDLLQNLNAFLPYRAVPSLLASMLQGESSNIKGQTIIWQLAQDPSRRKLVLVSQPVTSFFTKKNRYSNESETVQGTFAYNLEFAVQTQAGDPEPWINLYLNVRRYPDQPLKKINFQRNVTIMVGAKTERLEGWGIDPTLVPIPVKSWSKDMTKAAWADSLAELVGDLRFRALAEPKEIFADPTTYRNGKAEFKGDIYLPLFAEGMKPANVVKTGFSPQERAETVASILELLRGVLVTDEVLAADKATVRNKFSLPLASHKELKKKSFQNTLAERIKLALDNKPLQVVSFYYNVRTQNRVRLEMCELFGLSQDAARWEENVQALQAQGITFLEQTIDPKLVTRSESQKETAEALQDKAELQDRSKNPKKKKSRKNADTRKQDWENVWPNLPESESGGYRLAFIEAPMYKLNSPKGVLRKTAIVDGKAGSQMIQPVKAKKNSQREPTDQDRSKDVVRAKNGVADLLIRQTGVLWDTPNTIYRDLAGLPKDLAQNLTVIGLYRRRSTDLNVDYAMAVRILPDGKVEACLPSNAIADIRWLPYLAATNQIGRLFADKTNPTNIKLKAETLLEFLRKVVLEHEDKPTLVLTIADDWRNGVWTQLRNTELRNNELNLNNSKLEGINSIRRFNPSDLPNLRVIRLREKGSLGETPEYVATFRDKTWQDTEQVRFFGVATGFEDTSVKSSLYHYFSIAKPPVGVKGQKAAKTANAKREEGGNIPFKYQSALEIVPFFLQKGDEAIQWARIPHFLRKSPAWNEGGLLVPYPIHLAKKAIEDQLCMIE